MDQPQLGPSKHTRTVALLGHPNSGKTSLFNALSGMNQRVGNFPGVTVERKSALIKSSAGRTIRLVDLPGANSLYPAAEDEAISCQVLHEADHPDHPDLVIVVADVMQLRRGLMLCTQVIDLGFPVILALNMMDVAARNHLIVNEAKLSNLLGSPIVSLSARTGKGIPALRRLLAGDIHPSPKSFLPIPAVFRQAITDLQISLKQNNAYLGFQALLRPDAFKGLNAELVEAARLSANLSQKDVNGLISSEMAVRMDRADGMIEAVVEADAGSLRRITNRLDKLLTHPLWGYLIFLGILLLVFQAIFSWAEGPMGWIESGMGWLKETSTAILPKGWINDLISGGILAGLEGIIIFVPQIAFLFFFISLMEESGYMARVVYLMDRIMRPFGFSGKSIIPLMGGMACAIPSIMMTRSISNRTERLITILVTPLMSCSARLPVYMLLVTMFISQSTEGGLDSRGLFMTGLYLLGFVAALLVAWVFKMIFRYRSKGMFVMEMPVYRVPQWRNVGLTVLQKSFSFVWEAGKIILAISIVLWALTSFGPGQRRAETEARYDQLISEAAPGARGGLERKKTSAMMEASYAASLGRFIEPAIRPLGYDWKIGISLVTSFAAREVFVGTMSILYQAPEPGSEASEAEDRNRLISRLQQEVNPQTGKPVYTPAVLLSLIVFYAFAMQCMSTLAVTKKEAGWKWTGIMLGYMTALAYLAAFLTYQVFS